MKNLLSKNLQKETDTNENKVNKKNPALPKPTKTVNTKLIIIISVCLVAILLLLSSLFGFITSRSDKIAKGVYVDKIELSGLTKSQAVTKLSASLGNNLSNQLTLTHLDYQTDISGEALNAKINIEDSVNAAYNIGRSSNIFANNFEVITTFFSKKKIDTSANVDSAKYNALVEKINNEIPDKALSSNYKIENDSLIVYKNTSGKVVDTNKLEKELVSALYENKTSIEIPVVDYTAPEIDIDKIYSEIHKEPVDASFKNNPYELHKEEEGIDLAITIEEAKQILAGEGDTFIIPLKITKPKITVKDLPTEAFPSQLATYTTTYSMGNAPRASNISLAARTVNGYVLMPGETFSYNNTVGERTAARGYREAGVYVNGEVTTGLGGGICQVSSTLYNAALLTNLEILERTNHTFQPGYVPSGQDATVSWGAPDFKFKNNRDYPIKLVGSAGNGSVTFSIYGVKQDNDYEVKIVSEQIGTIPFSTQYENTASLPAGTQKVTHSGSNGCKTQTYKILYKDGAEVSRSIINRDTYKPHNQVVSVGTGTVQQPVVPQAPAAAVVTNVTVPKNTPTPTPTPTKVPTTTTTKTPSTAPSKPSTTQVATSPANKKN